MISISGASRLWWSAAQALLAMASRRRFVPTVPRSALPARVPLCWPTHLKAGSISTDYNFYVQFDVENVQVADARAR